MPPLLWRLIVVSKTEPGFGLPTETRETCCTQAHPTLDSSHKSLETETHLEAETQETQKPRNLEERAIIDSMHPNENPGNTKIPVAGNPGSREGAIARNLGSWETQIARRWH
jgi:hypothetical protein